MNPTERTQSILISILVGGALSVACGGGSAGGTQSPNDDAAGAGGVATGAGGSATTGGTARGAGGVNTGTGGATQTGGSAGGAGGVDGSTQAGGTAGAETDGEPSAGHGGSSPMELCLADESVSSNTCVACPAGTMNEAGDDPAGSDTECDAVSCETDYYVSGNTCAACPAGTTNGAGDDATGGDTTCDPILCDEDYYVSGHTCVACADGYLNSAGDDASGSDTQCCEATLQNLVAWDEYQGVSRASSVFDQAYPAFLAFDGVIVDPAWLSNPPAGNTTQTEWVSYRFRAEDVPAITSYTVSFSNGSLTERAPKDWILQGRNAEEDAWADVDAQSNQTNWSNADESRTFTLSGPVTFQEYRLFITNDNYSDTAYNPGVHCVNIAELQLNRFTCDG